MASSVEADVAASFFCAMLWFGPNQNSAKERNKAGDFMGNVE
jgi:hypothetical protein